MIRYGKNGLAYLFLASLMLISAACNGATPTEIVEEQVDTPTVLVTVFVTQVVATPGPTTPFPTATVAPPPPSTYVSPYDPWAVPIYYPLVGCSASRLHVGDIAFVALTGELVRIHSSQNIYFDPGIRDLEMGEEMEIIGGPECHRGIVVWRVKIMEDKDKLRGWVPEGDGENYWLLPVIPVPDD